MIPGKKTQKNVTKVRPTPSAKKKAIYVKPTQKTIEARVDELVNKMANQPNLSRYKLHAIFTVKWNVAWTTVDNYLVRAREEILKRLKRSKEEFQSNAVAFYESQIGNSMNEPHVRQKAQKLLCELVGANAATKVEVSGPLGGPVEMDTKVALNGLSVAQLEELIGNLEKGDNKV